MQHTYATPGPRDNSMSARPFAWKLESRKHMYTCIRIILWKYIYRYTYKDSLSLSLSLYTDGYSLPLYAQPSREIVYPWISREIDYFFYTWLEKE